MERYNKVDYISFLPDAIILIIMSFLPFKHAVTTSVLSKRFRNLWRSTTTVDLDRNFFATNNEFLEFIRRWMSNFHEPNLRSFRLAFTNPEVQEARQCVTFAVERRIVKALRLDFSDPIWDQEEEENLDTNPQTPIQLPFFDSHGNIESLELSACGFRVLQFNRFSALKNVFLGWIELPGCSLNRLITMCPVLESLSLRRCWNVGVDLEVNARGLRVLVIDKIMGPECISVNAPSLRSFKYSGPCVYMTMEYNRTMREAVFDFGMQREWDEEGHAEMLYNLLTECWSVRALTGCSYMLQVLPMMDLYLKPRLTSVTSLVLQTQLHIKEYYGITFFLNSCPKLVTLLIDLGPKRIFEDCEPPHKIEEHPFLSRLWCPACVGSTLSTLKVKGYKGFPNEQVVLRYLLRYGMALKYLFIQLSKDTGANGIDMQSTYRGNLESLLQYGTGSPHLICKYF